MIDFEVSETIGAPASEVFGFVSDLRNDLSVPPAGFVTHLCWVHLGFREGSWSSREGSPFRDPGGRKK